VAGAIVKLKALFKTKEKSTEEREHEVRAAAEATPALVKAKEAVCKLPDPTLLFMALLSAILLVHGARPDALRTWAARVLVPLALAPTVVASALWRRTRVIWLKREDGSLLSAAAPFPNAPLLVSKGQKLREREAALAKSEAELAAGQRRLEAQREDVRARLPPYLDIQADAGGDSGEVASKLPGPAAVALPPAP
jgi:hypothetical protein